jgi:Fur family ferric uptake transcriptional regulator
MSCGQRLSGELRLSGFRVTPQRGVILETIAHMEGHLSAHEVFEAARLRLPGLNIATVYRTLETLHEAGLVDFMVSATDPVRFSYRDQDKPHDHLVCRRCHQVLELDHDLLRPLASGVARDHGFHLDTDHLTLTGICQACQETDARH